MFFRVTDKLLLKGIFMTDHRWKITGDLIDEDFEKVKHCSVTQSQDLRSLHCFMSVHTIDLPLQCVSLPLHLPFRTGTLQFDAGHL